DLDELNVPAGLDDLAEDLVPEDQSGRRGGTPADHVLVAAADVGRDDLEDHAVLALAADVGRVDPGAVLEFQLGVGDVLYFDLARLDVGNRSVSAHRSAFLFAVSGSMLSAHSPARDRARHACLSINDGIPY